MSSLASYFTWLFRGPTPLPHPSDPPSSPDEITPYNEKSDVLTLPDGRKLGYAQYGAPKGTAVFMLHGMPGSRLDAGHFDSIGKELGARVIGIDRPGIGWSSPQPGRRLADHVKDVEAVADTLGIERFRIMGVSGGGPYALACARYLPAYRLHAVGIICGMGPLEADTSTKGIFTRVALAILNPLIPTGVRFMFQSSPFGRVDLSDSERLTLLQKEIQAHTPRNEAERIERAEIERDPSGLERALRSCREAFSRGFRGTGLDGQLMASRYGFKIEEIRKDLPVQLWYGTLDATTPIEHGRQIARRLGKQAVLHESEDTHGSLQVRYQKEAWKALLND